MNQKKKIKNKGIKVTWIAEKLGISQPLLSMYLSGRRKMPELIENKIIKLIS